jgi:hypothetical protein
MGLASRLVLKLILETRGMRSIIPCTLHQILFCDKIKDDEMDEAFARMEGMRNTYKVLVGNLEEKSSFGRPTRRWEDNIKRVLTEIEWEVVDWLHVAQELL